MERLVLAMIVAALYQGPFSGKRIVLPEPFAQYVIPQFGEVLDLEFFYLRAGQLDVSVWAYLFDDSFAGIA